MWACLCGQTVVVAVRTDEVTRWESGTCQTLTRTSGMYNLVRLERISISAGSAGWNAPLPQRLVIMIRTGNHSDRDSDTRTLGSSSPQLSIVDPEAQESISASRRRSSTNSVHSSDDLSQRPQQAGASSGFEEHSSARNDRPASPDAEKGYLKRSIGTNGEIHWSRGIMPIKQYENLIPAERGSVLIERKKPMINAKTGRQSSAPGTDVSPTWLETLRSKVCPTVHSHDEGQHHRMSISQPHGRYSTKDKLFARFPGLGR